MSTTLGQAYVQIMPSAKGISGSITKVLDPEAKVAGEKSGESVGSKMVATIGKIIAAAGLGKLISSALTMGGDLEQSIGGVETLFQDSADTVIAYAEGAYKTAGVSANDYMENVTAFSASLLQSMGGDTDKAAEIAHTAMVDMSDNANKMGTDMQSIQNAYQGFAKQNYTMLDNLKLGYGGTKSEMERLLADATKLTGVKYDIDNLADVYEAIHAVQEEIGITGTTVLEAEETFSGSLGMMKAAWQNMLGAMATGADWDYALSGLSSSVVTFAKNALPMLADVVSDLPLMVANLVKDVGPDLAGLLMETLTQIVNRLGSQIIPVVMERFSEALVGIAQSITASLPELLAAGAKILTGLAEGITQSVPILVAAIPGIITGVISTLVEAIPTFIQAGLQLFTALIGAVPEIISAIVAAIPLIIDGISLGITTMIPLLVEAGIQLFSALIQAQEEIISNIITALPIIIDSILSAITTNLPLIVEAGINLFSALVDSLPVIIENIVAVLPTIIEGITATLTTLLPLLIEAGVQLLTALVEDLPTIINAIVDVLPVILGAITRVLTENLPVIIQAGIDLLTSLVTALPEIISAIVAVLPQIIQSLITYFLENIPLIIQAGVDLLTALVGALPEIILAIVNALPEIITSITETLLDNIPLIIETGVELLTSLLTDLPAIIVALVKAMPEIISSMVTALGTGVSSFVKIGSELIKGLWQGIKDVGGWLWDKISGFFSGITDKIKSFFGIKSPSTLFASYGRFIDEGLAVGITDNLKPVSNAMDELSEMTDQSFETKIAYRATTPDNYARLSASAANSYAADLASAPIEKAAQPVSLSFVLGGHKFKAFVDDITQIQDRDVELELAYS